MKFERGGGRSGGAEDRILPLINVVFLLLIFFMVAGSLSATDPFPVDPPRSAHGASDEPRHLVLLIGADGRLALDGTAVEAADLAAALTERRRGEGGEPVVYVKADGGAEAVMVVGVMATLRDAGIDQLRLVTTMAGG